MTVILVCFAALQCQDYEAFLAVMFAEARRHTMDVQQIDVLIPEGMSSGAGRSG